MKQCHLRKVFTWAALIALGASLAPATPAAASATEPASMQQPGPKYCALLYGSTGKESAESPLLREVCSNLSSADAENMLNNEMKTQSMDSFSAQEATLLMTWFDDAAYNGSYTNIYTDGPTCDYSGYSIRPSAYWQVRISSIGGTSTCNEARVFSRGEQVSTPYKLPAPFLSYTLENNVGRIQVYRR